MALQKRFNDSRKQFVDPYWTIISGVLSHGRGRSKNGLRSRVEGALTQFQYSRDGRLTLSPIRWADTV